MGRRTKADGTECKYSNMCPKCGGRMGSHSTRLSKRYNVVMRTRRCIKCKYTVYTAEVDFDDYQKQENLIRALEAAISTYLKGTETCPKKEQ